MTLCEVVALFEDESDVLLQMPPAPHIDLLAPEVVEAPHTALAPHMHRVPLRADWLQVVLAPHIERFPNRASLPEVIVPENTEAESKSRSTLPVALS